VEGGIPAARIDFPRINEDKWFAWVRILAAFPPGWDARLYGRQDACRCKRNARVTL
jgi:hypothetical protein